MWPNRRNFLINSFESVRGQWRQQIYIFTFSSAALPAFLLYPSLVLSPSLLRFVVLQVAFSLSTSLYILLAPLFFLLTRNTTSVIFPCAVLLPLPMQMNENHIGHCISSFLFFKQIEKQILPPLTIIYYERTYFGAVTSIFIVAISGPTKLSNSMIWVISRNEIESKWPFTHSNHISMFFDCQQNTCDISNSFHLQYRTFALGKWSLIILWDFGCKKRLEICSHKCTRLTETHHSQYCPHNQRTTLNYYLLPKKTRNKSSVYTVQLKQFQHSSIIFFLFYFGF